MNGHRFIVAGLQCRRKVVVPHKKSRMREGLMHLRNGHYKMVILDLYGLREICASSGHLRKLSDMCKTIFAFAGLGDDRAETVFNFRRDTFVVLTPAK